MKKKLKWLSIILVIGMLSVIIIAQLIDLNKYKTHLNKFIGQYGFRLDIQGDIKLSFFPKLGIYIDSPTKLYLISDLNKEIFEANQVKFDLELKPLFSKKIHLKNLYLSNPKFNIDKRFLKAIESFKENNFKPEKVIISAEKGVKDENFKFALDLFEITNGNISYEVDKSKIEFSKVNIQFSKDHPAEMTAVFKERNKNVSADIKAKVNEVEKFIEGAESHFDLWAGFDSIEFKLDGNIKNNDSKLSISNLSLKFDNNELEGNLEHNKSTKITNVKGKLKLKSLIFPNDFAFLSAEDPSSARNNETYNESGEIWSHKPIDLSFLSNLTLDLDVAGKEVQLYGVNIDSFKGEINVKNDNLAMIIKEGNIAQGNFKGQMSIYSKNKHYSANLELKEAELGRLLNYLMGHQDMSGLIDVRFSMNSFGNNMASLIKNLQGTGFIGAKNGTFYKIKAIPTNILDLSNLKFNAISGNFFVKDGIISSRDLALSSPLLVMSGWADVNLLQYTINCLINPDKIYDNKIADKGFAVEIKGSLRDPEVSLNAEKFVRKTIKEVAKKALKIDDSGTEDNPVGKALNSILDNIL